APGRGHSAARPGRHGAAGPRVVARPLLAVARRGRTRRTAAVAGAVSASRQLAAGAGLAIAPGACYRERVTSPESCTRFTSEKYITISDTHTTPYSSMKQLDRICSRSAIAPNIGARKNPPSRPARPTLPVTAPRCTGKSSATYLTVHARPHANTAPRRNSSKVNRQT